MCGQMWGGGFDPSLTSCLEEQKTGRIFTHK